MRIINRFLWFVNAVLAITVSLAVLLAWFQLLPERLWLNELHYALTRQETLTVAVVFFLLNIHLLCCSLFSSGDTAKASKEFVLVQAPVGDVKVAVSALVSMLERRSGLLPSVRDIKAKIIPCGKDAAFPIKVSLRLVTLTGANVQEISSNVARDVQEQLQQTLGFQDIPVDIAVTEISNAPVENRRVV